MEIICIHPIKLEETKSDVTVGRIYTHRPKKDTPTVYYRIVNNHGEEYEYNKQLFMPLDEYRKQQLDKLTNEED